MISSALVPKRTGRRSFDLFQRVRIKAIREREKPFYNKASSYQIPFYKEPLDIFEFGTQGNPLVLLVHGWESNAGSLSKVAFQLEDLGYRVVAFNLPGHASYNSSSTNLLECKLAMRAVLEYLNPSEVFSVVAHSFGAAVATNALADTQFEVNRMVFLTNPNKVDDIFIEFKEMIGLSNKAYDALIQKTTELLEAPLHSLDVDTNLQKVNFDRLLLIHDQQDKVLPYRNSEVINAKIDRAELITLEGVGHYKMLWNDEVINAVIEFVTNGKVN